LEQIQLVLGHVSIQTTQLYLGCTAYLVRSELDQHGTQELTGSVDEPEPSRQPSRLEITLLTIRRGRLSEVICLMHVPPQLARKFSKRPFDD
jgi:hypothetical protein